MSGIIIAFEGIDNSGKSSQCQKLIKNLEKAGYKTASTNDYVSPLYEVIREYFSCDSLSPNLKILLFASMLFDHWNSHLYQAFQCGKVAVFDSYIYSLYAYGAMGNLNKEWIENIIVSLPKPDLTVYLDISPSCYWQRAQKGQEYLSPYSQEQLAIVRANFLAMADEFNFCVIDGTKTKAEIEKLIYKKVLYALKSNTL